SPSPSVTMSVWPSGWVCHAVRAPGSKVTLAPATRAGAAAWNSGSTRTVPENHSELPFVDGCDPARLMSMVPCLSVERALKPAASRVERKMRDQLDQLVFRHAVQGPLAAPAINAARLSRST